MRLQQEIKNSDMDRATGTILNILIGQSRKFHNQKQIPT